MLKYIFNIIKGSFSLMTKRTKVLAVFYLYFLLLVIAVILLAYGVFSSIVAPAETELVLSTVGNSIVDMPVNDPQSITEVEWNTTTLQPEATGNTDAAVTSSVITRVFRFLSCLFIIKRSLHSKESTAGNAIDYRLFNPVRVAINWLIPFIDDAVDAYDALIDKFCAIFNPKPPYQPIDAVDNFIPNLEAALAEAGDRLLDAHRARYPNPLNIVPNPQAVVEQLVEERRFIDPADQFALFPYVPVLADPVLDSIAEDVGVPIVFDGVTYAAMKHLPPDVDIESREVRRFLAKMGLAHVSVDEQRAFLNEIMSYSLEEFKASEQEAFREAMDLRLEAFLARQNDALLARFNIHEEGPADIAADLAAARAREYAEWIQSYIDMRDEEPRPPIPDWDRDDWMNQVE